MGGSLVELAFARTRFSSVVQIWALFGVALMGGVHPFRSCLRASLACIRLFVLSIVQLTCFGNQLVAIVECLVMSLSHTSRDL